MVSTPGIKKGITLPSKYVKNKTFNILSIGQRGVGKTVFLIGSYKELESNNLTTPQKLWFDCQNDQVEENIEKIVSYVVQTNQYPPPTMKIMNFSFSLKRQALWGDQTLCNFHWSDIPGEICNVHNLDFRNMVFNSHGCCVFIDVYALRHSDTYLQVLDDIFEQVMALTSLVYLNGMKYPLAIILTKSDLLEQNSANQEIVRNKLQTLTTHLNAVKADYQIFNSSIPLVHQQGVATLQAKGAGVSLLWIVWEMNKIHNPGLENQLFSLLNRILPTSSQPQQELLHGTIQSLFSPTKRGNTNNTSNPANRYKKLIPITLGVAACLLLLVGIKQFFPTNRVVTQSLEDVNNLQASGNFKQAILLLEEMTQRQPERIDLRLRLAQLYEFTGNVSNAEVVYDQIISRDKNNIKALVGKAILRQVQGDHKTATTLFEQAEKAAPDTLKSQVRALAENALNASPKLPKAK